MAGIGYSGSVSGLIALADQGYSIKLGTGTIKYGNPKLGVYQVQKTASAVGRFVTAIPASIGNTAEGVAIATPTYKIGDYVLYAYNASKAGLLGSVIILARIPDFLSEFLDVPIQGNEEDLDTNTAYYTKIEEALQMLETTEDAHILKNWINERLGGDYTIESKHTILRVSEFLGRLLAGGGGITVNAVDSSVTSHGFVENKYFATHQQLGSLISDTGLVEKKTPLKAIIPTTSEIDQLKEGGVPETQAIENPASWELSGELPYGTTSFTLSWDDPKTPTILAKTDKRRDGRLVHQSVTGFSLEKASHISGRLPAYDRSIYYDKDVTPVEDVDTSAMREPFDRTLDSGLWDAVLSFDEDDDYSFVRTAGDFDKVDGTLTDPDGSSCSTDLYKGRASITWLDSGGILLRDAWGSEIRLENGDIQISAARHINYIAGGDLVGISGGYSSITSKQGIAFGSPEGGLDLSVKKDINLEGSQALNAWLDGDVQIFGESDFAVSMAGIAGLRFSDLKIEVDNCCETLASTCYVLSSNRTVIAGAGAITDYTGIIHIAASNTFMHGPVRIVATSYNLGKVGEISLVSTSSGASFVVDGYLTTQGIGVNGSATITGGVWAKTCTLSQPGYCKDGYGVYKGNTPRLTLPTPVTQLNVALKDPIQDYEKHKNEEGPLQTIFEREGTGDNKLIKPKFSGHADDTTELATPVHVVLNGEVKYIYPGKEFWENKGLIAVSVTGNGSSVLDEQLDQRSISGAKTIQLAK